MVASFVFIAPFCFVFTFSSSDDDEDAVSAELGNMRQTTSRYDCHFVCLNSVGIL